jgi:hypothetical protein
MSALRLPVVLILLLILPTLALAGEFPWKPGDQPPLVAGIRLGDGRVRLEKVLGKPSQTEKLGEEDAKFYRQKE